mmetsp:Transcript_15942/g.43732  ORF Transcript_15942/g.43732 Transcript_15942/m.43732 type:complete len:330 (-) Transcript_15942:501-1490(-)
MATGESGPHILSATAFVSLCTWLAETFCAHNSRPVALGRPCGSSGASCRSLGRPGESAAAPASATSPDRTGCWLMLRGLPPSGLSSASVEATASPGFISAPASSCGTHRSSCGSLGRPGASATAPVSATSPDGSGCWLVLRGLPSSGLNSGSVEAAANPGFISAPTSSCGSHKSTAVASGALGGSFPPLAPASLPSTSVVEAVGLLGGGVASSGTSFPFSDCNTSPSAAPRGRRGAPSFPKTLCVRWPGRPGLGSPAAGGAIRVLTSLAGEAPPLSALFTSSGGKSFFRFQMGTCPSLTFAAGGGGMIETSMPLRRAFLERFRNSLCTS